MMADAEPAGRPLLEVEALTKHFPVGRHLLRRAPRHVLRAVDGVSLTVARHSTLGLVGESGCGKSTLGRLMIRLLEPTSGRIVFDGIDIATADPAALRQMRSRFQMVFQDPLGSLDPRVRVGDSIAEPLGILGEGSPKRNLERAAQILSLVGLDPSVMGRYPHEFSGGQKQRISIARALIVSPQLIVADEPVSALDVSVRAQIVNLFQDVQEKLGLSYVFVSHDLGIVRHVADHVAIMYLGKLMEYGVAREVLREPAHPYTRALVATIPPPRPLKERPRAAIVGDLPNPIDIPRGCRFASRCPLVQPICREEEPELRALDDGRKAACHFA